MPNVNLAVFALFILSVATVVGLGLFVITVVLRMQHKYRKRLARVGRGRTSGRMDLETARQNMLRQTKKKNSSVSGVSDTVARFLPFMDKEKLLANIQRAGMSITVGGFVLISLVVGALLTVVGTIASGYPVFLVIVPAMLLAMFFVNVFIKFRGNRLSAKFMRQMPEGIDTIIRGIRSGLPVIECIGTVGQEYGDPIGSHFRTISESVAIGEPIEVALWRVARVIDKPEMDFLAISIAIQMETGGSLSDALNNLANLLRERERMKKKIKAISSEAKASAMIIGALPFMMLGLLTMMSPEYVAPLFTDPRGHIMLGAGLTSISMGAFVMWRMTQFEI